MPTKEKESNRAARDSSAPNKRNKRKAPPDIEKQGSPVSLVAPRDGFPIVGVGTSAGGIRALEGLLRNMPSEIPFAMVVIQHLDPKRESIIPTILSRATPIPVHEAKDGEKIEIGKIYVKPSDKDMIAVRRKIKLMKPEENGVRLPIDRFFRSLAADAGEKAIGIILSGAGSDGSQGAKEIQGAGGLVMVQDEKQADHPGMPRSALDSLAVDLVLPVEEMGEQLLRYTVHPMLFRSDLEEDKAESQQLRNIQDLLHMIRARTGHDFTQYKLSTVRRRIARRMAVNRIESLKEYARFLRENLNEPEELFKDLVVSVTSFFRDPQVFLELQNNVIPDVIAGKEPESILRIWVPGCATGEEAYSLAMLFLEEVERTRSDLKLRIFATDINPYNIDKAREGAFRDNIAADVSPERLQRFFETKGDGIHKIRSSVRELIVFSVHDITRDAPLVRMDLVSCRNVLIYMNSELQRRVLPVLHYSLNPGGVLVLGTSEGIGDFHDVFDTIDKKNKIFKKKWDEPARYQGYVASLSKNRTGGEMADKRRAPSEHEYGSLIPDLLEEALSEMGPPGVIVDENNNIVYFIGKTSTFLSPPSGMPSFDVIRMADQGVRHALLKGVEDTRKNGVPANVETVPLIENAHFGTVNIRVRPISKGHLLITFDQQRRPDVPDLDPDVERTEADGEEFLKERLRAAKQQLQSAIEEFETTNEELKSANEELQANNEELQSTNEELESSKEELQSTNEELETTNLELHRKNEELLRAQDDARNLFASTDIGTLFLDRKLLIKRYTPPATRLFNLIENDIGRPIADITSTLSYENFLEDVQDVLANLNRKEVDVQSRDGRWFSVRMLPYRNSQNVIDGVIITFGDVTRLKEAEAKAMEARAAAEAVMQAVPHPIVVLDDQLHIRSANPAFCSRFKTTEREIVDQPVLQIQGHRWSQLGLEKGLKDLLARGGKNREYSYSTPEGEGRIKMTACRTENGGASPVLLLLVFEQ